MKCTCHRESPYHENQLWSLQNALIYGFDVFIDKTTRMAHWPRGLTYSHSSLSHAQRIRMTHYAKNDVMAVSYLVRPIIENWSLAKIKETNIEAMLVALQPTLPPPLRQPSTKRKVKNINVQNLAKIFETTDSDIETIPSDDEIYLNQLTSRIQDNTQQEDHRSTEGLSRNGTGVADENAEFKLATAVTNDKIDDDLEEPTNEDLVDISDDELVDTDYTTYACRETQGTVDMFQLVPASAEQQQPQQSRKKPTQSTTQPEEKKIPIQTPGTNTFLLSF
ncbi:unnamed protein product [Adineta ricciae]|uniref:Uncharacterized protein n=1 Tax=Adineta ricciae TaxID=249248 RepID=A0A815MK63_ADIRI|nr:unnamed protein product [Adineta ricciae]CAF1597832.1 unnamed protein product [Adineta ricciae]